MRVILTVGFMLLQVLFSLCFITVSANTEIVSPPTFPTFTLHGNADGWSTDRDLGACNLAMQRLTRAGSEVSWLTYQQPTTPACSAVQSLMWIVTRDRLAVWLNALAIGTPSSLGLDAFANDAMSSLRYGFNDSITDVTSNLSYGLRYTLSEHLSWTVQGLTDGSQDGTQIMLLYSPFADWYMRWSVSGWSLGDGTSSAVQQVQLGYQGYLGPQVSVTLARQLIGLTEFDTTTFTLSTSLHDVSAQINYRVAAANVTFEDFSAAHTLGYLTLSLTFPISGWWWTVSGMMGDLSNVVVSFSREDGNLAGNLSLVPLGFGLSYETKF